MYHISSPRHRLPHAFLYDIIIAQTFALVSIVCFQTFRGSDGVNLVKMHKKIPPFFRGGKKRCFLVSLIKGCFLLIGEALAVRK